MGAIVQTLTLAIILLIIGLTCLAIGATGLIWKARRDQRLMEEAEEASRSPELSSLGSRR